jgi:hypothetical protein
MANNYRLKNRLGSYKHQPTNFYLAVSVKNSEDHCMVKITDLENSSDTFVLNVCQFSNYRNFKPLIIKTFKRMN